MGKKGYDEEWYPRMLRWEEAIAKARATGDVSESEWTKMYIHAQHPTEEQVSLAIETAELVLKRNGFKIKDHSFVVVSKVGN